MSAWKCRESGRVPRDAGESESRGADSHVGIPSEGCRSIGHGDFNMLPIKGIYGREMYETWYKMSVMLESGLDISPVITHRYHYTEFEKGFEAMSSGTPEK